MAAPAAVANAVASAIGAEVNEIPAAPELVVSLLEPDGGRPLKRALPFPIAFDRGEFDHVGIPTSEEKEGAVWLEADRVWVTNPRQHPLNVEWVRYAPDSPMHPRLKSSFHVAYRVEDLGEALRDLEVLVGPLDVGGGFATVAFVDADGLVLELMQYGDPQERGWVPEEGHD